MDFQKKDYDVLETPISTPDLQSAEVGVVDDLDNDYALNLDDAGNRSSDLGANDDESDDDGVPVMTMKGKRRKSGVDDLEIMEFAENYHALQNEKQQMNDADIGINDDEIVSVEDNLENVKEKEVVVEDVMPEQKENNDDDEQGDEVKEITESEKQNESKNVPENEEQESTENPDEK